jgi:hypothetical protein
MADAESPSDIGQGFSIRLTLQSLFTLELSQRRFTAEPDTAKLRLRRARFIRRRRVIETAAAYTSG